MEAFFAHVEANKDVWIDRLREAVAIQSISAENDKRGECIKMMHWAADWAKKLGSKDVTLHDIGTQTMPDGAVLPLPPIVTATVGAAPDGSIDPSKKIVVVYGHLDVQPAKLSDGWDSDPFVLTLREHKGQTAMFGRGSTDDKGPVLAWLWVIESYQALGKALPVNLKFVLEGTEESGSEGLEEFVRAAGQAGGYLSGVDCSVVSDNYWLGKKPCITYGLRGICYFTLEITCASKDLHSGVYGGPVAEAMQDLVKVLATLNNADGTPVISFDSVAPVTPEEEASYAAITSFEPSSFASEVGAKKLRQGDDKAAVLKARWRYPTLSIHGVEGAWSGPGAKTVIPRSVIGKFSLRIVPHMTPEEVEAKVTAHVEAAFKALDSPNSMKISMMHGAKAWLSDVNDFSYRAARRAIKAVHGTDPELTREGGSIPLTLWLQEATGKSVLLLPIGACDDSAHSTNEKFDVANYINGIKIMGQYLEELAQ